MRQTDHKRARSGRASRVDEGQPRIDSGTGRAEQKQGWKKGDCSAAAAGSGKGRGPQAGAGRCCGVDCAASLRPAPRPGQPPHGRCHHLTAMLPLLTSRWISSCFSPASALPFAVTSSAEATLGSAALAAAAARASPSLIWLYLHQDSANRIQQNG